MPEEYSIDADGNVTFPRAESQTFDPVPIGEYDLVVQNIEQRFGKDSGNPYFAVELRTDDPNGEYDNKPVWENISPSVLWRMTQFHDALYGPSGEEGEELSFNIFDAIGARLRARLGIETGRDQVRRNTVVRFLPLGEGDEEHGAFQSSARESKKSPASKKPAAKKPAPQKRKRR